MNNIDDRLHQEAARWRAHSPSEPPFRPALTRAVINPTGHHQRRQPGYLVAAAAAVIAVVASTLAAGHLRHTGNTAANVEATTASSASRTVTAGCAVLPRSSGPYADSVIVSVTVPADATAGDTITVHATLTASGQPLTLADAAQPAALVLLHDGNVVAHSSPQRGTGYLAVVSGNPRPLSTAPLHLSACTPQTGVNVNPAEGDAAPLSAGTYQLAVVFQPDEHTSDVIVSDPVTLQITS